MKVLLLFDSRGALTGRLAQAVADGVPGVSGAELLDRAFSEARSAEPREADALILKLAA